MTIASVNPNTGELLESFEAHSVERTDQMVERAYRCLKTLPSLEERLGYLARAADILEEDAEKLGRLMALEMGKPIGAAIAEARKCAWVCRYYGDEAPRMLAREEVDVGPDVQAFVRKEPLGVVLAVMPWNFPFWQVFRFAAPALAAGNVALLKHASNVPRCALAIEDIFLRAGFPEGSFQTLLVGVDRVQGILADPRIAAVTLTGSERAGAEVASFAGRQIKKALLELGGSDPFIVMPSADIDRAARIGAMARIVNGGQSCIAAKRFIVHGAVFDAFVEKLRASLAALEVGDPLDEATDVGPLATASVRDDVERQVEASVEKGARVLLGGKRLDGPGFFYPPTLLVDVPNDAPAACEEVFGPVASVFRVSDVESAIRVANETRFGLGASVWTEDEGERARFIEEIEAGLVFVNAMVASDPRLPFGGVKRSGFGRELGDWGMREWVNAKTVWVARAGEGGGQVTE